MIRSCFITRETLNFFHVVPLMFSFHFSSSEIAFFVCFHYDLFLSHPNRDGGSLDRELFNLPRNHNKRASQGGAEWKKITTRKEKLEKPISKALPGEKEKKKRFYDHLLCALGRDSLPNIEAKTSNCFFSRSKPFLHITRFSRQASRGWVSLGARGKRKAKKKKTSWTI